jgi:hypothetical protein
VKARPQVTIEEVLVPHEKLERRHPPGSSSRGQALDDVHHHLMRHAEILRQRRRRPNARVTATSKRLVRMVVLFHKTGETNHRTLAKAVLGKEHLDEGVDYLARRYGKMLREAPWLVEYIINVEIGPAG